MFFRLRRFLHTEWFNLGARAIERAPPVTLSNESNVQTVTQVYPPDLWMYVVAIKTFARFVPLRACWVVADRLTEEHRAVLRRNVPGIQIVDLPQVSTAGFPNGACWERLLHIIDVSRERYTIQIDADTITTAPPTEILDCVAAGRCFTLGTQMGREVVEARSVARQLAHLAGPNNHVQVAAELAFDRLAPDARYIRGNAAFAGFAKGAVSRALVKQFSEAMSQAIGDKKWREWGSEQVASNYCVANTANPYVLPFERYRYFDPASDMAGTVFWHFIGHYRFAAGVYRRMTKDVVRKLLESPRGAPYAVTGGAH
jgi:hypothetical protein